VAAGLDTVDIAALRSRFDPDAMAAADLYPDIWSDGEIFDNYLAPYFTQLCRFYRTAADNGQAVLLVLT
jgi:hypothetical protein